MCFGAIFVRKQPLGPGLLYQPNTLWYMGLTELSVCNFFFQNQNLFINLAGLTFWSELPFLRQANMLIIGLVLLTRLSIYLVIHVFVIHSFNPFNAITTTIIV